MGYWDPPEPVEPSDRDWAQAEKDMKAEGCPDCEGPLEVEDEDGDWMVCTVCKERHSLLDRAMALLEARIERSWDPD